MSILLIINVLLQLSPFVHIEDFLMLQKSNVLIHYIYIRCPYRCGSTVFRKVWMTNTWLLLSFMACLNGFQARIPLWRAWELLSLAEGPRQLVCRQLFSHDPGGSCQQLFTWAFKMIKNKDINRWKTIKQCCLSMTKLTWLFLHTAILIAFLVLTGLVLLVTLGKTLLRWNYFFF